MARQELVEEDLLGVMPEAEIYDLSEPEEDYAFELSGRNDFFPREEISLPSMYHEAFVESQNNPQFKRQFRSMVAESLRDDFMDEEYDEETGVIIPQHKLYKEDRFTFYADVRLPSVVRGEEVDVNVSENRLMLACPYKNYHLDVMLPVKVYHKRVIRYFDKFTRILTLKMPIKIDLAF